MTKFLMIAYYFPPIGGAGVQRSQKFAQYLPDEGYLPTVITAPALPEDRWTPRDQTLMATIPNEVPIHRAEGPVPAAARGLRGRMERWLDWPSEFGNWWIESATRRALQVTGEERLVFATMSPWESGTIARQLSERLRIPWVADLRDPWALDEMQVYPTFWHRIKERRKMEELLRTASLVVMNTPDAAAALRAVCPALCRTEILCITNGFDSEDFSGPLPARSDGKFRIAHSGYLHTESGLKMRRNPLFRLLGGADSGVDILTRSHFVLLEAVDRWCRERPAVRPDVELLFVGQTSAEDRALAKRSPVGSMIRFNGYVSHRESLEFVRTADVLFLPMHNLPPGKRSRIVPGKAYEYMASGRPILAAVPDGDARDFLEQSGNAFLCRPDDTASMAKILNHLYEAWLRNEQAVAFDGTFAKRFERRRLTSTLSQAFDRVLNINSLPPKQPVRLTI